MIPSPLVDAITHITIRIKTKFILPSALCSSTECPEVVQYLFVLTGVNIHSYEMKHLVPLKY